MATGVNRIRAPQAPQESFLMQHFWRILTLLCRLAAAAYGLASRPLARCRPRRILVVKLDAIGDVVLLTPFLRELRRSFPHAKIALLVQKAIAPLVELCPYVDTVI